MSTVAPDPTPTRPRRIWPWVVGAGCALVTVLATASLVAMLVFGVVALGQKDEAPVPGDQPEGTAYLQLGDPAGERTVDVYLDYLCPFCKTFEEVNGADLQELADSGVSVRLHPRAMLDQLSTPSGYSGRAANAAACVYDESPDAVWAMSEGLYAQQPAEGKAGLEDAQLIEIAHAAGASDDVDSCITSGRFVPWVEDVVEPEAQRTKGTPAVYIDGTAFTGDLMTPGVLKEQVEAG